MCRNSCGACEEGWMHQRESVIKVEVALEATTLHDYSRRLFETIRTLNLSRCCFTPFTGRLRPPFTASPFLLQRLWARLQVHPKVRGPQQLKQSRPAFVVSISISSASDRKPLIQTHQHRHPWGTPESPKEWPSHGGLSKTRAGYWPPQEKTPSKTRTESSWRGQRKTRKDGAKEAKKRDKNYQKYVGGFITLLFLGDVKFFLILKYSWLRVLC